MKNFKDKKPLSLSLLMIIFCAAIFLGITFILEPLLVLTSSDVVMKSTPIPIILDISCELAEILAFALCYSLIIFAANTKNAKAAFGLFGIYAAASTVRRGLVLVKTFITYSSIDELDISNVGTALLLECLLAFIVTLASVYIAGKSHIEKAELTLDFNKVFSKTNPLLVCALVSTAIMALTRIALRIISDIQYGAPTSVGEVLIMAAAYLFDILLCAVFYAVAWLMLSKRQERSL